MSDKLGIEIGIEQIRWMSARGIVNNTINEKSTLILLVTGFLSGAGTLVLQYTKTHRDRAREDRQKKEDEFRNRLKEDFLAAINLFLSLDKINQAEDWDLYERLVRPSGWEYKLPPIVLDGLKKKENDNAKQVAETLHKICEIFDPKVSPDQKDDLKHLKSLRTVCDLALVEYPQNRKLTPEEISCLLITYKRWRELKPLITSLIHEFAWLAENLSTIDEALVPDKDGLLLLKDASIEKLVEEHVKKTENDAEKNKAAKNIHRHLSLDIKWRPIWSGKERKLSYKTLRWLSWCWFEDSVDDSFSIGSEYAELDIKLSEVAVPHPVLDQMDGAFPSIVFGGEGMGKTASALQILNKHQGLSKSDSNESKVFPVYAPFESGVDVKEWLVEKVSRALIDFTADNPRRFLTAPDSQKTAMGRLMLRHTQNVDALRLNFYSSPSSNNATDIEQALEYISTLKYVMPPSKLTKEETLNLLYIARPDIFDQIYILWDIRSATPQDEVVKKIKEIEEIAISLARQNVFIKIFAPLSIKKPLGSLAGFHSTHQDLTWSESQIKELIDKRIKMFTELWERGIDDPMELVMPVIGNSPRRAIRFLVRLMDYIDEHLSEGKKLSKNAFKQMYLSLTEKK